MNTANHQPNDEKLVADVSSPKASSSNHYNCFGIPHDDIIEINNDECIDNKKPTAAENKPISIDLTSLSDQAEVDCKRKKSCCKSPIIEYRVGYKGKQHSHTILHPKCSDHKCHSLDSLDSNSVNKGSSDNFSRLSSIDLGPFNMKGRVIPAFQNKRDFFNQAHCSTDSIPVNLNSVQPKKRKRSTSFNNSSDSSSCLSKMFHPPRTAYIEQPKRFSRHWNWSNFGIKYHQESRRQCGFEFSIMSYNILAQDLLEFHSHLYTYCNSKYLSWEYRKWRLLREIDVLSPDIMCLQEVQQDHYENYFKSQFAKRGYEGIFCPKSNYQSDGCATFYKVLLFVQISSHPVDYMKGGVLDRGNVGLIVGLKPRNPVYRKKDSRFYVANTHLLFNPRRGDVKLAQLILLLTELEKIAFKCKISSEKNLYHPFIMCGDFNTEPFSQIYNFIVSSYLRYEDLLIREMSGQSDENYGKNNYLTKDFFPSNLNINCFCQYIQFHQKREGRPFKEAANTDTSPNEGTIYSTTKDAVETEANVESSSQSCDRKSKEVFRPFQKGIIKHSFNLVSVYNHVSQVRGRYENEVSSYHNKCCSTVDYIFYAVDSKMLHRSQHNKNMIEGNLKLICCYQLPSEQMVREFDKLPNKQLGSDHFSLLASFLLV